MRFLLSLLYELSIAYPAAKQNPLWTFFTYHSIVNTLNLDNCIRGTLYVQIRNLICTVIHRDSLSAMHLPWQVNEEKGDRNSADAFPYRSSARHIGKYAGDCKTNTMFDGTDFDGIETEET